MIDPFVLSPEVRKALEENRPVVALETTVVTHGLPAPAGREMASALENIIRLNGATPATIGVLGGKVRIGMDERALDQLVASDAIKVNPGNLATALASGIAGSTTVAATVAAAHRVGIRVFATGGIGGVHRGSSNSGDVSADLTALSQNPVAVVCAGAKAILDLPKTLEALETLGVPVVGYRTDEFPAFYRRYSGLPLDSRCNTPAELAGLARMHFGLGASALGRGLVVANPLPAASEMPRDRYETGLQAALDALEKENVRGRAVTPFLLQRLDELTAGEAVSSNRALLASNAEVASLLACALT